MDGSAGKPRDPETGLDDFGARYNSSQFGRFMTPDPLGGHMSDPQSLNKYPYARDNPARFTDPSGRDLKERCSSSSSTCQKQHWWSLHRYVGTYDGHHHFHVTHFQTDGQGRLAGHDVSFNSKGIHIDGHEAEFIAGSPATRVNGQSGTGWQTTHFVANSNCLGTCLAGGGLFANNGGAFLGVAAFGLRGPNLGIDKLGDHPGLQYRGGNPYGPDVRLSFIAGATELPMHFDTRFPYGNLSGFTTHAADWIHHEFETAILGRTEPALPSDINPVPQP